MVPDGWREYRLDEIVSFVRGLSWSKGDEVDDPDRGIPVLSIPNVQPYGLDLTDVRLLRPEAINPEKRGKPGTVLLVGSNGNPDRVGNCAQLPSNGPFFFASFLLGLEPRGEKVDPAYLYRVMADPRMQKQVSSEVQGSTGLRNINARTLKSYRVTLPPNREQRKIAAILTSVEDAIAATRAVIDQTRRVKKGLLQTLMTRGIGHTRFKKTEIGEIPEAWDVARFDDLFDLSSGKERPEFDSDAGVPVWGGNGVMGYSHEVLVKEPTVVIGRVGHYCGVVHSTSGPAWITDNVVVQPNSDFSGV